MLQEQLASSAYQCLNENAGHHPNGENCKWESAEQMKKRVMDVLKKYTDSRICLRVRMCNFQASGESESTHESEFVELKNKKAIDSYVA